MSQRIHVFRPASGGKPVVLEDGDSFGESGTVLLYVLESDAVPASDLEASKAALKREEELLSQAYDNLESTEADIEALKARFERLRRDFGIAIGHMQAMRNMLVSAGSTEWFATAEKAINQAEAALAEYGE